MPHPDEWMVYVALNDETGSPVRSTARTNVRVIIRENESLPTERVLYDFEFHFYESSLRAPPHAKDDRRDLRGYLAPIPLTDIVKPENTEDVTLKVAVSIPNGGMDSPQVIGWRSSDLEHILNRTNRWAWKPQAEAPTTTAETTTATTEALEEDASVASSTPLATTTAATAVTTTAPLAGPHGVTSNDIEDLATCYQVLIPLLGEVLEMPLVSVGSGVEELDKTGGHFRSVQTRIQAGSPSLLETGLTCGENFPYVFDDLPSTFGSWIDAGTKLDGTDLSSTATSGTLHADIEQFFIRTGDLFEQLDEAAPAIDAVGEWIKSVSPETEITLTPPSTTTTPSLAISPSTTIPPTPTTTPPPTTTATAATTTTQTPATTTTTTPPPCGGTYTVGGDMGDGAQLVFDGLHIWTANYDNDSVSKLQASDGALIGTYPTGSGPTGMAFDGTHIWTSNLIGNSVSKLRASDGALIGTYPVGLYPRYLAFDGAHIWASNGGSNSVSKLRASDGELIGTYSVVVSSERNVGASGIAFDGTHIWTANSFDDSVSKLRASDGELIGTYPAGDSPLRIDQATHGSSPRYSPQDLALDGAHIWTANSSDASVSKLRASDGELIGTYPVPGVEAMYGIAFDGTHIYTSEYNGGYVSKLRASDGALIDRYLVGNGLYGMAFDGTHIWAAISGNLNGVWKLCLESTIP
jgi:cell division septation protein DedD